MTDILKYMNDGAYPHAQAVMCYLKYSLGDGIEGSWNDERKRYDAEIKIARWENCREQGYVVSLRTKDFNRQLNIAFFEHRNSDDLCAIKWEQTSLNSLTIDTAKFGDVYKDKYDVSLSVRYDEIAKIADWIKSQFESFWKETMPKK